ncbi:hypothetical protein VitviT2T_005387 [Vitis vinifera]|uniref:Seipin-1 n=3 Tax=Vitis vinifera TaxID=29760 RepID=A0ABY9BSM4_VITVI|nr:seipin-1 [Vitis vinifera]XP_010649237.1 seipin-1 [Vitis vinifera]XP_010649239.1 seipin-1 [Vitis vinifera]WJZ85875.1 hypothetical protein VitviT2T_005387 [Vitis vinifera]|eukprot:XP_002272148.1 PREDICTED: seipin-1 [Vitis vinifera]
MEEEEEEEYSFLMAKPPPWFTVLLSFQADLIHNCIFTLLAPVTTLFSILSESYQRAEEAKDSVKSAAKNVPSKVAHGSSLMVRKLAWGLLGAAYMGIVLVAVMVVAVVVGVGLVQLWVEEPVFLRESLHFDYTEPHPKAVFSFGGSKGKMGVPLGHTFYVSLRLLMPESDFNRDVGVFQLTAEVMSINGDVIAKSSHPCMLRFRSLPVQLTRTFLMGVPLLLGISSETQELTIEILKHKEGYSRTKAIRVTLIPRAGTLSLPQIYEAELLMNSQLPWKKKLVHSWKWTFYVWMSLYVYIMLLVVLMCCFRPVLFPVTTASQRDHNERDLTMEVSKEPDSRARDAREASESLKRWQRSRNKRKVDVLQKLQPETVGSSASSITITREDTSAFVEEDVGDSESVC